MLTPLLKGKIPGARKLARRHRKLAPPPVDPTTMVETGCKALRQRASPPQAAVPPRTDAKRSQSTFKKYVRPETPPLPRLVTHVADP